MTGMIGRALPRRQRIDVDLGMAEEPEDGLAKEGADAPVGSKKGQSKARSISSRIEPRIKAESREHHEARHEQVQGHERHAVQRHPSRS
jgi:hypothetical protein